MRLSGHRTRRITTKQTVALFGASGTMGLAAFKELWQRQGQYHIVLLVRPTGIFGEPEQEKA